MARLARTVEDVLLGEATHGTREERLADLLGIASVIHNRAALHGVTPEQIVSAKRQFDSYGRALPAGVEAYRALAKEAWDDVSVNGPIHAATYFATPSRVKGLPNGLTPVGSTTGHRYFLDPEFRPIQTALGVKRANPAVAQELLNGVEEMNTPTPDQRPINSFAEVPGVSGVQSAIDGLINGAIQQAQATYGDVDIPADANELGAVERTDYQSPMGAQGDRITSGFGSRTSPLTSMGRGSRNHAGIDMALQPGQSGYPAEAMGSGVVSDIAYSPGGFGNKVSIRHPDGLTSTYGHLRDIASNINLGDEVATGTPIGTVGSTGKSTGAHLHFEVRDKQGNPVDPTSLFSVDPDPSVPSPQFAQRAQPGDLISSIANEAVQPTLGDPNEALAASFNTDRFAGPTQEQTANFDAGRFGDPNAALAESFDMGRMGLVNDPQALGRQGLADALAASNNQAAMKSQQMAGLQERANEARRALEEQAAQSAQATQSASLGSPLGVDGQVTASTGVSAAADAAGITPRSMADLAGQYAAYGAGKVSPEDALAADVYDQALTTKQGRTPSYAMAQKQTQQEADLDMGEFAQPDAVPDYGEVTTPTLGTPSRAKQAVEQSGAEKAKKDAVDPNKDRLARSFTNSKTVGSALGAVIGGMLGGPVGAMALGGIGAKLGDMPAAERPRETPLQALFNMMMGKPQSMFPSTPPGGNGTGKGVSFNDLNKDGRGVYGDSGQFRDAIDKGGVGLY